MIKLETPRLLITNWQNQDFPAFHALNSDKRVMAYFPTPKSEEQSLTAFKQNNQSLLKTGLGFCALYLRKTNEVIGMAGILTTNLEPIFSNTTHQIAWRILPNFQKQGLASEAATCLLNYAFKDLSLHEVVAYAVKDNIASIKVMQRIGMAKYSTESFDHPEVPDSHPHLKTHLAYRLQRPQEPN